MPGLARWDECLECVVLARRASSCTRHQAMRDGRPDPREMEAEITAPSRRVRQLENGERVFGKASAFFASGHQNTSGLN